MGNARRGPVRAVPGGAQLRQDLARLITAGWDRIQVDTEHRHLRHHCGYCEAPHWEIERTSHSVWRLWSVNYCPSVLGVELEDMEGVFVTAGEALDWMLEKDADACKCNGPPAMA